MHSSVSYNIDSSNDIHKGYLFDTKDVRRRIHWGCYIAGYFLSPILGRLPPYALREIASHYLKTYTICIILTSSYLMTLKEIVGME